MKTAVAYISGSHRRPDESVKIFDGPPRHFGQNRCRNITVLKQYCDVLETKIRCV